MTQLAPWTFICSRMSLTPSPNLHPHSAVSVTRMQLDSKFSKSGNLPTLERRRQKDYIVK